MAIIQEFREFAMKGNVVDLAVGVIMGAAFAPIVSTLVDNIIMPPIGYAMAGIDFSSLAVTLPTPTGDGVAIKYGLFMNAIIKFLITAFAIFLLVKAMNSLKRPAPAEAPAAPPPPTPSEVYLKEIRDALVARKEARRSVRSRRLRTPCGGVFVA
jgi:large conductance mechanosensitive channel